VSAPFLIKYDDAARRALEALPAVLRVRIERALARLAANPVGESKRSHGLRPRGQLFELEFHLDGSDVYVDVMFRYSQDETTLQISNILVELG
jgi:hypothetical protein